MEDLQLQELEHKIDLILAKFGLEANVDQLPENVQMLKNLVRQGQKVEAVKRYREQNQVGLAEAKRFVDALEDSEPAPARLNRKVDLILKRLEIPYEGVSLQPALQAQIRNLLRAKNKLEAIKIYRAATNASLAEAKTAVEALEGELKRS